MILRELVHDFLIFAQYYELIRLVSRLPRYISFLFQQGTQTLSLSLDISYTYGDNQKQFTVSNIYRSPSPTNGLTANEQFDDFHSKFDDLLSKLSNKKVDVYVFLDSNINLFNLDVNNQATTYMANISNSGFLLTNFRATRIQNDSPSLIDHILTNCKATVMTSGTIVDDLSDHFMTFFQPNLTRLKTKPKCMKKRLYTTAKLDDFKRDLQSINWKPVTDMTDVDTCYDQFWQIYSKLHDHHFPLTTTKFNKNIHRISDFMTTGLLISRSTKLIMPHLTGFNTGPTEISLTKL